MNFYAGLYTNKFYKQIIIYNLLSTSGNFRATYCNVHKIQLLKKYIIILLKNWCNNFVQHLIRNKSVKIYKRMSELDNITTRGLVRIPCVSVLVYHVVWPEQLAYFFSIHFHIPTPKNYL